MALIWNQLNQVCQKKTYCSRSHCLTSESSTGMLWNEHLRKKPKNCTEVCGVEAYDTIKKLIEENTNVQIFTWYPCSATACTSDCQGSLVKLILTFTDWAHSISRAPPCAHTLIPTKYKNSWVSGRSGGDHRKK